MSIFDSGAVGQDADHQSAVCNQREFWTDIFSIDLESPSASRMAGNGRVTVLKDVGIELLGGGAQSLCIGFSSRGLINFDHLFRGKGGFLRGFCKHGNDSKFGHRGLLRFLQDKTIFRNTVEKLQEKIPKPFHKGFGIWCG